MKHILTYDEFCVNESTVYINRRFEDEHADNVLSDRGVRLDLELNHTPVLPEWAAKTGTVEYRKAVHDCEKRFGEWERLPEDVREVKHLKRMSQNITPTKAVANVAVAARMFGRDHIYTKGYLDALVRYQGFTEDEVKSVFGV